VTKFVGGFDYDQIKAIITSGEGKAIIVDPDGNIVGDIPLSTLARTRVYEQSFEDGTSDLTADNATQTVQSSEVYSGSYALQVTISAGQTGYVETPVRHVSPNQEITVVFAHKEDANITDVKLIVVWYRTNMRELATEEFTLDVTDTWKLESRTVTAPKKAAYMAVRIQATAGSSADGNVYVDDITIDLVGQIFRVDGAGQIKVVDTDLLDEIKTKLDIALSAHRDALLDPVLDQLILNNATIDSEGESNILNIRGAKHVDVLIYVGAPTGSPNITFHLQVIEPTSGKVIRTYDGNQLTGEGADWITVDGLTLGTHIKVTWDGTLDSSNYFSGCFVRIVAKR